MTAHSSRKKPDRPGLRGRTIVYLSRALAWSFLAILISIAGVADTPLGIGILFVHFVAVAWALVQLKRGSEPTLTWGIIRCDDTRAKVMEIGDRVRVQVWHEGPGIPGTQIEAAFSEFVQIHEPASPAQSGFGLGLSIVKKLAEAMGASVE